ncbi:hypothetical protein PROFUN_11384 [Planoprotostelium fungivorum]|uniref:DUF218 domain-containing protein n=1 Tax=Planoprotostelium fungivorum TaxID=1890364 RepID=A0A2P6N324_9EUKA|nr:hypothetical protein PROFUN_11384 [Planoprotostelium fungivorum]
MVSRSTITRALFLVTLLAFLIINLQWISPPPESPNVPPQEVLPDEDFSYTAVMKPARPDLKDLIMVAGHAIYLGDLSLQPPQRDDGWILESFQRNGQVEVLLNHIQAGMKLAESSKESLLIFSGGETRVFGGAMSEAQSYYWLAHKLYSDRKPGTENFRPFERATTEEHAGDSYENLLFSICRFREVTGSYPRNITVVGFEFKRERFEKIHRYALRFPMERFNYVGIDPLHKPIAGETVNSFNPYVKDLYGCHGTLREKRESRNPFRQYHGYEKSCSEIARLIRYCPKTADTLYSLPLPWDKMQKT